MKSGAHSIVMAILCIALAACGSSAPLSSPVVYQVREVSALSPTRPTRLETVTPSSVPISFSFPTQTPLPTSTATPIVVWGDFPGPTEDSEMEIPFPMPAINFPENTINILLLGTDRRSSWKYYQTDALMILSLDPVANTATFLSVPRDLYVYVPGWKVNRINTAEYRGGFEMIADTVLYNLGIPVHHWVKVEYSGFADAIDILGGIDVRSSGRVKDMCEGISYEYDPNIVYHMDGFTAMCYARMRMKSSDFDRLRRQQDVFLALFDQFVSINGFMKVPQLYDTFSQFVETDMGLDEILPLLPLASKLALDPSQIRFYRVDSSMIDSWETPESHASVLLPKRELIQAMLEEAFSQ